MGHRNTVGPRGLRTSEEARQGTARHSGGVKQGPADATDWPDTYGDILRVRGPFRTTGDILRVR